MLELMQTPSQRHVIPLQGRPYERDSGVAGLLTVEFLFKAGWLGHSHWSRTVVILSSDWLDLDVVDASSLIP